MPLKDKVAASWERTNVVERLGRDLNILRPFVLGKSLQPLPVVIDRIPAHLAQFLDPPRYQNAAGKKRLILGTQVLQRSEESPDFVPVHDPFTRDVVVLIHPPRGIVSLVDRASGEWVNAITGPAVGLLDEPESLICLGRHCLQGLFEQEDIIASNGTRWTIPPFGSIEKRL